MTWFRHALRLNVLIWLLCQVGGSLGATVALAAFEPADGTECTCAMGNHTFCPMHHHGAPARCRVRGGPSGEAARLVSSLLGISGTEPTVTALAFTPRFTISIPRYDATASWVVSPPTAPPPRH